MNYLFCTLFLLTLSLNSAAQNNEGSIWVFGENNLINFNNTDSPVASIIATDILYENASSIADKNGNLLFYLGGTPGFEMIGNIRNRLAQIIENGDSIFTNYSATQGSIILPAPGITGTYYIFHLQLQIDSSNGCQFMYYSIIDMNQNGGLGKVMAKNVPITTANLVEKLTAVRHANGRDWWLLAHTSTDNFVEYLLTPAGLSAPLYQQIGTVTDSILYGGGTGQMKFSPKGDRLAAVSPTGTVDLFDFDRCTGLLSRYVNLGPVTGPWGGYYAVSFSPSGNILYTSSSDVNLGLYQYNLLSTNIIASRLQLWNTTNYMLLSQQQLAPDGKIYLVTTCTAPPSSMDSTTMTLSVINQPDIYGMGCDFRPFSFALAGAATCGLPNMPNYSLGILVGSACDTIINSIKPTNELLKIQVVPNPFGESISVSFQKENMKQVTCRVRNAIGQLVFEHQQCITGNSYAETFNLNSLAVGIYTLEIITDGERTVKELVKQ